MSLELVSALREKYKPRPYGRDRLSSRLPPGGADVLRLCKLADDLEALVRDLQSHLDTAGQNDVERRLWSISA